MKTHLIRIDPNNPEMGIIKKAAKVIKEGGIVAFPTETVYGLGVNASDEKAVSKLYKLKHRHKGKPFTIQLADKEKIEGFVRDISPLGYKFINQYWPGPLTLVFFSKNGGKLGIRIPDHPVALNLIKRSGLALAVTSANMSGNKAAVSADDVSSSFDGRIDMILDGGKTSVGVESAVVDMTVSPFKVLREGTLKSLGVKEFKS